MQEAQTTQNPQKGSKSGQNQIRSIDISKYKAKASNFKNSHRVTQGSKGFSPSDYLVAGLSKQDIIDLKEVFDDFDLNSDGLISPLELRAAMRVNKNTIFHIISQFDEEELGELDFRSFLEMAAGRRELDSERSVKKVFINYDKERKGYVTVDDLKRLAVKEGEKLSDEEVKGIMEKFGTLKEGETVITYEDFVKAMNYVEEG